VGQLLHRSLQLSVSAHSCISFSILQSHPYLSTSVITWSIHCVYGLLLGLPHIFISNSNLNFLMLVVKASELMQLYKCTEISQAYGYNEKLYIWILEHKLGAVVAQSVQCLTTDWTPRVRSPTEAKDFSSSLCIQTGSGAHPASYSVGTGVLSPGVKHDWGVMLTTHPHLVPRLRMSRSCTSSLPRRLHGV
jgi:hypothetical protein